MKKFTFISTILTALGTTLVVPATALAAVDSLKGNAQEAIKDAGGSGSSSLASVIESIVNILIFVVGAASVIMIVIGGIRYVLSGGDANATQGAKNTILYAIVGIIVAAVAYSIVNFVLNRI